MVLTGIASRLAQARAMSDPCPCNPAAAYADCCGRFHAGADPETCGELMRARYSAFAKRDAAFLMRTSHPAKRKGVTPKTLRAAFLLRWHQLDVLEAHGGPGDDTGLVHFRAHYRGPTGGPEVLEERSRFVRDRDGSWVYRDADG